MGVSEVTAGGSTLMIAASTGWLTPTRAVGMISFGCAALASGLAWNRLSGRLIFRFSGITRLPMMLTFLHATLLLDIAFNWRWRLHGLLMNAAIDERLYGERRLPQVVVLSVLALVLGIVCVGLVRSYWRSKGALLALLGTGIALASWCMEVISLHQVDALLYGTGGSFMAVTGIWILAGMMTAAGITLYSRTGTSLPYRV